MVDKSWCYHGTKTLASQLARFRELLGPLSKRIVVVVDDREVEDLEAISAVLAPIAVLPWSRRAELARFIIKDTSDSGYAARLLLLSDW